MSKVSFKNNILIILLFIIISCLCVLSLNTESKKYIRTTKNRANNVTFRILRSNGQPPRTPPGFVMPPRNHMGKPDNYYEPYWKNGDWVFYRNSSTRAPTGYILNTGSTKHTECDQICIELYEEYGPVCGMRLYLYNDLDAGHHHAEQYQYVYKSFKNMCYLELANCIEKKKTWFPAHRGNCSAGFTKHPILPNYIKNKLSTWLLQYTDKSK